MALSHMSSVLIAFSCLLLSVCTEDSLLDGSDQWGIPDRVVTVGKLFQMRLPHSASTHTIREVGHSELPLWLQVERSTDGTWLSGVPAENHAGQQVYLEVLPSDEESNADVFSVKVTEEPVVGATQLEDVGAVQCDIGSSVTVAGVLLDASLDELSTRQRVDLLRDVGKHLNMPATLLRLAKPANKALFDSSALVAGAGNVKSVVGPALHVEWQVGCGNVHAHHMPILQKLETSASDGHMANAIGHGIVGWHVSNKKPMAPHRVRRYARDIRPTATTPSTGGVPTKRPTKTIDIDKDKWRKSKSPHSPTIKYSKSDDKMAVRPSKPIEATRTISAVQPSVIRPSKHVPESRTVTPPLQPSIQPSLPGYIKPTDVLPSSTVRTPKPTETVPVPPIVVSTTTESYNYPPVVKHEIKPIIVSVGDILHYKIHKHTFYDKEDGNSRNLKLELSSKDGSGLSPNLWLRFNIEKQVLYGMPWISDIGKHEYYMVAVDSAKHATRELFTVKVVSRSEENEINHEFSLGLDLDYEEFMQNVDQRLDVAKKIAHVYGDHNTRHMSILRMEAGSVQYAWTNKSLSGDDCPANDIDRLVSFLITQNRTLNETMVEKMKPYRILRAGVVPLGSCQSDTVPPVEAVLPPPDVGVPPDDDNLLVSTVLPAIIIAVILLLAGIIACFLYRKKRNGKLSDEDKETFHSKGAPIIFEDELDENSEPSSKPLISKDEKPPLSPPDYQQHDGSGNSSPDSLRKQKLDTTGEDEDDLLAAPVTGSVGSRGGETQPLNQPACRQPPPYVAP